MSKGKSSFVLYHDIRKPLELLDDAQRGKLFTGILNYSELGIEPDFGDAAIEIAFAFIRNALDRDAEAWEDKREKRAIAGSFGGKQTQAKRAIDKQNEANQAIASSDKQNEANQAVPVPVPVPVNVPVIEKKEKKEKSGRAAFSPPTLEEVKEYCAQRHSTVDPLQFWEYFDTGKWRDAKGNPVKNWKQKLLTWEKFDCGKPLKPNQIHGQAKTKILPEKLGELIADLDRI